MTMTEGFLMFSILALAISSRVRLSLLERLVFAREDHDPPPWSSLAVDVVLPVLAVVAVMVGAK